jgi:hypothetical protein
MGTYEIVAATGEVRSADRVWDDRFWGGILSTYDYADAGARERVTQAWYAGMGYDPDLVSQEWWDLYEHSDNEHLVSLDELPATGRPGAIAHFDLESRKVTEVFSYEDGAFPSPPTFVPRRDRIGPNDGYVVVLVHKDLEGELGKEIHIFDAQDIGRGPLARAAAPGFNPPLLLHSYWMDRRCGPRPSNYRVPLWRDVAGALASYGRVPKTFVAAGKEIRRRTDAATTPTSGPGDIPM